MSPVYLRVAERAARKAKTLAEITMATIDPSREMNDPIHRDKISWARNNILPIIAMSPPNPRFWVHLTYFPSLNLN